MPKRAPITDHSDDIIESSIPGLSKIIDKIKSERIIYVNLFKEILMDCNTIKEKLDMYYDNLQWYHSIVQTSVIVVSTGSTFIQSILDKDYYQNLLSIITISISTYSGLILSLGKFFKLDEKKENVHNLRERFAELHNKIKYHIDLLKPWENDNYYDDINDEKMKRWINIIDSSEKEYLNIIDIKKILFMEFEKLIDTLIQKKYSKKHNKYKDKECKPLKLEKNGKKVNNIP